jgi:hypothetical protein
MQKKEEVPNIKRDGWDIQKLAEEATNEQPDEIMRKTLRGSKNTNQGNELDIAGSIDSSETPHGREENKRVKGAKK